MSQPSTTPVSVETLSVLDRAAFVQVLDGVYERSPWIMEATWSHRPFRSREALHRASMRVVRAAEPARQLALIRAHPELAARAAVADELTERSRREQSGAGLDRCSPEQFERLHALNAAYRARFGFPFVMAVRGHDVSAILDVLARRVHHTVDEERETALDEIAKIAAFRLADLVTE